MLLEGSLQIGECDPTRLLEVVAPTFDPAWVDLGHREQRGIERLGDDAARVCGITGRLDRVAPGGGVLEVGWHDVDELVAGLVDGDDTIGVPLVVAGLVVATKAGADVDRGRAVDQLAALVLGIFATLTPADFDRSYFIVGRDPHSKPIHALMSNGANTTFVVDLMDEEGNKRLYFGRITMSGTGFFADSYMRLMAHFPLLAQSQPEKALLICFGVGNTAASIAARVSSPVSAGTVPIASPVAGFETSIVPPAAASTHSPSM